MFSAAGCRSGPPHQPYRERGEEILKRAALPSNLTSQLQCKHDKKDFPLWLATLQVSCRFQLRIYYWLPLVTLSNLKYWFLHFGYKLINSVVYFSHFCFWDKTAETEVKSLEHFTISLHVLMHRLKCLELHWFFFWPLGAKLKLSHLACCTHRSDCNYIPPGGKNHSHQPPSCVFPN